MTAQVPRIRIGKGLGDVSDYSLRFYRQIGVEAVHIPSRPVMEARSRPLVPPTQHGPIGPQPEPWDEGALRQIVERVAAHDLQVTGIGLPLSGNILMGRAGRDADIERVMQCLRVAGRLGLGVVTYTFSALRASEGYAACVGQGRGGANLRDFDHARIADLEPLPNVGHHSLDEMWEHLAYLLQAIVPVAETAGVRLRHPPQ